MSLDHHAIAQRINHLAAVSASDGARRHDMSGLLHELHALLQVHFDKEEQVYLPLFARLTADQHAALLDELHAAHS
jgi:hypothetical protein